MATSPRTIHVPAGLPIDEATRFELLDAGKANLRAENVRQDSPGALGKRLGFASLTRNLLSGSISSGLDLFDHKGVPCCTDEDRNLYEYSAAASAWVSRGQLPNANLDLLDTPCMSLAASGAATGLSLVDIARAGDFLVTAHSAQPGSGGNSIYVAVQDSSGAVLRSLEELVQGTVVETTCALASYGDRYVIVFIVDGNSANISARYIDLGSAASINTGWVSIGNIATDKTTSGAGSVNVSTESLTDRVAIAYVNNSGGASRLTVTSATIAGVSQTIAVSTSSNTPTIVALEGSIADTLWVAWDESTALYVRGLDADNLTGSALATTGLVITLGNANPSALGIVSSPVSGSGTLIANNGNAGSIYTRGFLTNAGAVNTNGSLAITYNVQLQSRPFAYDSRWYAFFSPDNSVTSNAQRTVILCDFTTPSPSLRPVVNVEPLLAVVPGEKRCHWVPVDSTGRVFASGVGVVSSSVSTAARIAKVDFTPTRSRPVLFNGATYFDGGCTFLFDGVRVAESGFLYAPSKPVATITAGPGPTLTTGRRYVAVYEESEANGNWAFSAISSPSEISGATTNETITVATRPYTITSRLRNQLNDVRVRVTFYATANGGEEPYYRLTSMYMNPSSSTNFYVDSTTDADLITRQKLGGTGSLSSTPGAALDRDAPPGLRYLKPYNGMLVGACGDTLWCTAQVIDGEASWWSRVFSVELPEKVTALDAQDGSLFPFSATGVYAVAGEPPVDNFSSGGLGVPRRLAADVGASSGVTCITNVGIVFSSVRGIELLTRSQSVDHVGEAIQSTLASYPIVTAAVLDTKNGLLRISLAASESAGLVSGTGRDVVFDLLRKAWISVDIKNQSSATPSQNASLITISGTQRYGWIAANGTVYYEKLASDSTAYCDGSTFNRSLYELAPVHFGMQQEQRIYEAMLLLERHTDCAIKVEVANDFGTYSAADDKDWTAAEVTGKRQLPFRPKARTSGARFIVSDSANGTLGNGRGATFVGLSFDLTPIQGTTRGTSRLDTADRR